MKNIMRALFVTAVFTFSVSVQAHEYDDKLVRLTVKEQGELTGFVQAMYTINAIKGPMPPYLCGFELMWDAWYNPVEFEVRHYLTHLSQKERRNLPFLHYVWKTVLNERGCGDYEDFLAPYHPHK